MIADEALSRPIERIGGEVRVLFPEGLIVTQLAPALALKKSADRALYQAKSQSRNRVSFE
ncbi:MAG: hypothetical protein MZV65_27225 [Chromatiales bacterium]|nr:hypothetical protein [Chromatiales bacterium]